MLRHNLSLDDYLEFHTDAEPPELERIYRSTHLRHLYPRMCSGHYQGRLLKMLTAMVNPLKVLEIGTFTGYSALAIAEGLKPEGVVHTIEIDEEKEAELRQTFATATNGNKVILHIGDALDIIPTLADGFDMVFIDGNKRHYTDYLYAVLPKVKKGAFILVDNTLWDMKVVDGNNCADAQSQAIARFNDLVASDARFEKIILPVRDGLTIIRVLQ